tara:strand:- start:24399 stop:25655 length:1257 start_codon:yes stop_codon:yes gene_type:complete
MALSTAAGTRAAKKFNDLKDFGGAGDPVVPNTTNATPQGNVSTKQIAKPQGAEVVATEPQGELLRYPISQNSYFASMTFRMKQINPWDVDAVAAKQVFEKNLLMDAYDILNKERDEKNARVSDGGGVGDDEIDGVQTPEERFRNSMAEEEDAMSAAGGEAARFTERKKEREKAESEADKGLLGIRTSYVPGANQISLYMPMALNMNDTVDYQTPELGAAGAGVLAALNNAGGLMDAAKAALDNTFAPLTDLFNTSRPQAAQLAASRAATMLPQGIEAAAQIGLQVKINPNQRTVFNGVNIRMFTFQYDFVATSAVEAEQVKRIIRHFRTELYPSTFGREEASIPIGYKFPNLFEIKFRWGDEEMPIPQPILCHLKDVQTVYNPGSMTFHADGNATHIQMTLIFQEFRALTREDIEKGH